MATIDLDTLGGRIRAARKGNKLTIGEAAARIDISRTSLSQWENGGVLEPNTENLIAFTELTNITLDWLLSRKGEDPKFLSNPQRSPPRDSRAIQPAVSGLPEVSPLLTLHARALDPTPRNIWFIPEDAIELALHAASDATVVMRINARHSEDCGLSRGDYVLIDTSYQAIDDDGLYLVTAPDAKAAFFSRTAGETMTVLGRIMAIIKSV